MTTNEPPKRELYTLPGLVDWAGQKERAVALVNGGTESVVWVHSHPMNSRCVDTDGQRRGCVRVDASAEGSTVVDIPEDSESQTPEDKSD